MQCGEMFGDVDLPIVLRFEPGMRGRVKYGERNGTRVTSRTILVKVEGSYLLNGVIF